MIGAGETDPTHIAGHDIAIDLPGDVVNGMAGSVPRHDLEIADGDGLAMPDDLQLARRHAFGVPPQRLEHVAIEPLGAGQELGAGIDEVGHTRRMRINQATGSPRQHAGAARVIEVNVGGEDRRQVFDHKAELGHGRFNRLDGARRPTFEEDEPAITRGYRKGCDHLAETLESEVDGREFFHGESLHGAMYTLSMDPPNALIQVLTSPTPDALWNLRADLLEEGVAPDGPIFEIICEFRTYLDRFATSTSSRDLNHLASKLDIGAIGGVVLEQLFESPDSKELAMRVLTGGISEGLMVLASRQYVRAAEGELAALFRDTAWTLYHRLWRWTTEANPELESSERRQLLDRITEPLRDTQAPSAIKAILAGRLYQVLLLGSWTTASSRP